MSSQLQNRSLQGSNMMTYNNQINSLQQQPMMTNPMMQQQRKVQNQGHMDNLCAMKMYNVANEGLNNSMTGAMTSNNNSMNSAMHGMQNMSIGSKIAKQKSNDDGFGDPMGGSSQQQNIKNDAFSSLGGMNVFR